LCVICNKAYFVTKFCVNTNTSFTGIFYSGASQNFGGGVKLGCGPKQGPKKEMFSGLSENEMKKFLAATCLIHHQ
jgi:hypothetical protein